jgi:hypothetical protein
MYGHHPSRSHSGNRGCDRVLLVVCNLTGLFATPTALARCPDGIRQGHDAAAQGRRASSKQTFVSCSTPKQNPTASSRTTYPKADERQKLDYERQYYRHAEMIVRSRLQLLQGSVDETIKAVKTQRAAR